MLKNAHLDTEIGVDRDENEPPKAAAGHLETRAHVERGGAHEPQRHARPAFEPFGRGAYMKIKSLGGMKIS